jgi:hypothetical protein
VTDITYNDKGQDDNAGISHYVDETPYYRPPISVFNGMQEVPNSVNVPKPKKTGDIKLLALAGIIGLLTLGSVIYSED